MFKPNQQERFSSSFPPGHWTDSNPHSDYGISSKHSTNGCSMKESNLHAGRSGRFFIAFDTRK
ncbi:hypothetical protein CGZ80_04165 [Rhodopirellula sp. MGV]|nr:hypothetical protein CGZ80_04165 [Rhodopirellula sp. MGV]PNY37126.1 hypothetical protein C2E31_09020 [Rhodopirellula baltica]